MLTIKQVEAAKPREKNYKMTDAHGLYLLIKTTGGKYWRHNYVKDGKQKTLSIGVFPAVGLADARRALAEFKDGVAEGVDDSPFFEDLVRRWLAARVSHLSPKYAAQVARRLFDDIIPILGKRRVASIGRRDLVAVLSGMVDRGVVDSAHRMADTLNRIFDYAIDVGDIETHPASGLVRALPVAPVVRHQAAVSSDELPELVRDICAYDVNDIVRLAMLFALLTFVRSTELRLAKWDEFDFEAKIWTVPSVRMKGRAEAKHEHFVPLSDAALTVLAKLRVINGDVPYVFASVYSRHKPMNSNALLDALEAMGYAGRMTAHGFRSVASTWLNEAGFNPDAIEAQLAHKGDNKVRSAYNRAQYLAARVELMDKWGENVAGLMA